MPELYDNSKMPIGKFKDVEMIDVPAEYLLKVHEENQGKEIKSEDLKSVMEYIEDNLDVLKEEIRRKNASSIN
jgi:uncharacterized protein (DUF3820 family)